MALRISTIRGRSRMFMLGLVGVPYLALGGWAWGAGQWAPKARPAQPKVRVLPIPPRAPGSLQDLSARPGPERIDPGILVAGDPDIDPGILVAGDPDIDPGIFATRDRWIGPRMLAPIPDRPGPRRNPRAR